MNFAIWYNRIILTQYYFTKESIFWVRFRLSLKE